MPVRGRMPLLGRLTTKAVSEVRNKPVGRLSAKVSAGAKLAALLEDRGRME